MFIMTIYFTIYKTKRNNTIEVYIIIYSCEFVYLDTRVTKSVKKIVLFSIVVWLIIFVVILKSIILS